MTEFLHTFHCGHTVKCEYIKRDNQKTQNFTVVYAHGFCSDPYGRKPEEIKKWCVENGVGFFRYEIAGHGSDRDNFEKTDMNVYKSQVFEIIEKIVEGPVVVAGCSLGGWLMMLAACHFKDRVIGFLGLAAAPDFLKTYFINYFKPEHKAILDKYGKIEFPTEGFNYVITKRMLESAHDYLLLENSLIPITCKVRLIQGMSDQSLKWPTVLQIAENVVSQDVKVYLLKSSNHRLGSDEDLYTIRRALDEFLV